jgi:hypothetical protein
LLIAWRLIGASFPLRDVTRPIPVVPMTSPCRRRCTSSGISDPVRAAVQVDVLLLDALGAAQ